MSDAQRTRFKQIRYQCLMDGGKRTEALAVFGIKNPVLPKDGRRRQPFVEGVHFLETTKSEADRVQRAMAADYVMIRHRDILSSVIPADEIDRRMGKLSIQLLNNQASGYGGLPHSGMLVIGGRTGPPVRRPVRRTASVFGQLAAKAGAWYADAIGGVQ